MVLGLKMALGILSTLSVEMLIHTVEHEDVNTLVKVPGVGKKTAERLMIELRDRFKAMSSGTAPSNSTVGANPSLRAILPLPKLKRPYNHWATNHLKHKNWLMPSKRDFTEASDIIRAALKVDE